MAADDGGGGGAQEAEASAAARHEGEAAASPEAGAASAALAGVAPEGGDAAAGSAASSAALATKPPTAEVDADAPMDVPQAPPPALPQTIVFVLLCLLQAFFTLSRVSQTVAMSTDQPVWEGYTGEEMMAEVCAASRTNAPRGTYKVDKIIWPPGICSPRGRYKVLTSTVNVLESAMLIGGLRGPATLIMVGDVTGTLLEHALWMGGTLNERLGTTVVMWPYLCLAMASFCMRPVGRTLRGPSLGLVLRAMAAGAVLRFLALLALVDGPTMRGRPSAQPSATPGAEL